MKISSNVVRKFNDENNFPHKLLLTNTQVSKVLKAFENGSTANIKLSKTPFKKIKQLEGFLGRLLEPFVKPVLPLIGNVLKSLAKSVLTLLELTAGATGVAIHNKIFGSGMTVLIISNEEMNHIMKIVKSLEETGLLKKGVSETIKNEPKEKQRRVFKFAVRYIRY